MAEMSPKPEFWASVQRSQGGSFPRNDASWQLVEESYARWNPRQDTGAIPRRLHQIWLGSPLPRLYARWAQTWRRFHPDWEYRLWTEKDIDAFGLQNRDSYEKSPNYGVKSDIARYEILERLGGVYADTDFECLGSFDPLAGSTEFFAGLMYGTSVPINNGLIGSRPGHPVLQAMMGHLTKPFSGHDGMEILAYSGPTRFSQECLNYLAATSGPAVILPTTYFYAFPNHQLDHKTLRSVLAWAQPESLAIHYWEVSWKQQSWSSRIYWSLRRRWPRLTNLIYRLLKGRNPTS